MYGRGPGLFYERNYSLRAQRITSLEGYMARNLHACVGNGIGTLSTIRRDLPIPVLYETITKDVSVQSRVEITFIPCAYSTMCKPRPAFARTEGKYGYEYRREMARLVVLTHDARC